MKYWTLLIHNDSLDARFDENVIGLSPSLSDEGDVFMHFHWIITVFLFPMQKTAFYADLRSLMLRKYFMIWSYCAPFST